MNKIPLFLLLFGISADMITTVIGQSLGFQEGNIAGFTGVYIVNAVLFMAITYSIKNAEKIKVPLLIEHLLSVIAGSRFAIATINISLFF